MLGMLEIGEEAREAELFLSYFWKRHIELYLGARNI
jgi:hypothetical protein